ARAHLHRLGAGTVHKAGLLAAAGLVAWEQLRGRLADDHRRARRLADLLRLSTPETNIGSTEPPAAALRGLAEPRVPALPPDVQRTPSASGRTSTEVTHDRGQGVSL